MARKYGFVFWWKSFLPFSLWRLVQGDPIQNNICSIEYGIYLKIPTISFKAIMSFFISIFKQTADHS